ncbi:MAG: HAAS signaling domain-containing protein [Candidatus Izemoplasmataceae bacterium]
MNRLIEAYIKEVANCIPEHQREDIKAELSSLIHEEIESENKTVDEVLLKLGNPRVLAKNYMGKKNYVIGPRYYDAYISTLKLFIPIVLFIILLTNTIGFIFSNSLDFPGLLGGLLNASLIVFGYVTIGFFIAEQISDQPLKETWSPKDLNTEQFDQKKFSKGEIISGLIFTLLLAVLFNLFPHLIGVHSVGDNKSVAFFNLNTYGRYLLWFNIAFILMGARLLLQLFFERYTKLYALISIFLNTTSTLILVIVLLSDGLLNPNLSSELIDFGFSSTFTVDFIKRSIRVIVNIMVVVLIIEVLRDIYFAYYKSIKGYILKQIDATKKE